MRKFILKIIGPFVQAFAKQYFAKPRSYSYKEIKGTVLPSVFFPHWTLSTKLFLQFIEELDLSGKTFLELGCGSGFISLLAAKKGAKVIAVDINPKALENTKQNAAMNQLYVEVMKSNMFESLDNKSFDFIVINPPYYPKQAANTAEQAWYCGENFEYFHALFQQLPKYLSSMNQVLMILSEDCDIEKIQSIGLKNQVSFNEVQRKQKWGEWNYIYQLKSI